MQFLRRPSKSGVSKRLAEALGIESIVVLEDGTLSKNSAKIDVNQVLFNYGVAGNRFVLAVKNNPDLNLVHVINHWDGLNKFNWIRIASDLGLNVPESVQNQRNLDDTWLAKPYYSKAGKGIVKASEYNPDGTHYFQKQIQNRKYELRVTFAGWVPVENWLVWKKIMKDEDKQDQITWNRHTGGTFVWVNNPNNGGVFVRAMQQAKQLLDNTHLSFGAADFIVDTDSKVWFLEVNTLPGFTTEDNKGRYVNLFKQLIDLTYKKQLEYVK